MLSFAALLALAPTPPLDQVWPAYSDQAHPLLLECPAPDSPIPLPVALRATLPRGVGQWRGWPTRDEGGKLTWVLPQKLERGLWNWTIEPVRTPHEIYADFLELPDLYSKPAFGNCVWTQGRGNPESAWRPESEREPRRQDGTLDPLFCRPIPQPALMCGQAVGFTLARKTSRSPMEITPAIRWVDPPARATPPSTAPRLDRFWPKRLRDEYISDVEALSQFADKSCASPKNDLRQIVAQLESRHRAWGLETERQEFSWRGIPQANLVAKIPGRNRALAPVVLVDHIDTAFAEERAPQRVSVPGADDNVSGTAALLMAARVLARPALQPLLERDIWIVHITGEEFPSDGLGTRHWIAQQFKRNQKLHAVIVLDMIGFRKGESPVFQINAGDSESSLRLAELALALAEKIPSQFEPVLRERRDPRSYLYNTDAVLFSNVGFPVILINEHINAIENLNRKHYHQMTDTPERVDYDYALHLTRVALETALAAASSGG